MWDLTSTCLCATAKMTKQAVKKSDDSAKMAKHAVKKGDDSTYYLSPSAYTATDILFLVKI